MYNLELSQFLEQLILWLPAVIIALTFHEYAHGKVADWLGDPTPRYQGRLSLNPLVHLDPLGFIMLLLFHFGWAKPVQVNPLNFRGDRYQGMVLVALAGPGMNLLVAFTAALITTLAVPSGATGYLPAVMDGIVFINIYLALFNLIPVPPLDGSQVLAGLIRSSGFVHTLQRYGYIILILLIITGAVWSILGPLSQSLHDLFFNVSQGIANLTGLR
jgi:Zn-dependent protease